MKPGNVLLARDGRVKLGDFGIARLLVGQSTATTDQIAFTPEHVAPEVLRNEPDGPWSDVYGLASTLATALVGDPPLQQQPGERMEAFLSRKVMAPAPALPDEVPAALAGPINRALDPQPSRRPTVPELRRALASAARSLDAVLAAPATGTCAGAHDRGPPADQALPDHHPSFDLATRDEVRGSATATTPAAGVPGAGLGPLRRARCDRSRRHPARWAQQRREHSTDDHSSPWSTSRHCVGRSTLGLVHVDAAAHHDGGQPAADVAATRPRRPPTSILTPAPALVPSTTAAVPPAVSTTVTAPPTAAPATLAPAPRGARQPRALRRRSCATTTRRSRPATTNGRGPSSPPSSSAGRARSFEYYVDFWNDNDVDVGDVVMVSVDANMAIVDVELNWTQTGGASIQRLELRADAGGQLLIAGEETQDD